VNRLLLDISKARIKKTLHNAQTPPLSFPPFSM
jgi:hypothetical protein